MSVRPSSSGKTLGSSVKKPVVKPKPQSFKIFQPKVVLPFMITVATVIIGLRVDDMWNVLLKGKPYASVARSYASSAAEGKTEPKAEGKNEAKAEGEAAALPDFQKARAVERAEEADKDIDPSILKQLSDRRAQLDVRSQELDAREAMVKIGEQRMEQKLKEMEAMRVQVQSLVGAANSAQQAQLDNLVKIYETMKAKEAARIFETMEMPTLLGVVERMKPARVAAVLAEMPPEKAKDITIALTKKDQLPQIK